MADEEYRKVFAEMLSHYMELNGKTQTDLIKDLGFTRSAVSTWCNGTRLARPEVVDVLAKYFNVERSDLLEKKEGVQGKDETYYINKDAREMLQAYNDRSELKVLFDASKKLTTRDVQYIIGLVEDIKKTRQL